MAETENNPTTQTPLRIQGSLRELRTHLVAALERLDAIEAAASAGESTGQTAKRLLDHWCTLWAKAHGNEKYVVVGGKDVVSLKRALKALPEAELKARMVRYLADDEPWLVTQKHPLSLLLSSGGINRYAPAERTNIYYVPVGCQHTPPCRSDADHTRRVLDETMGRHGRPSDAVGGGR